MSHESGFVKQLDGTLVGWFEYDGRIDLACSPIFADEAELSAHWRTALMAEPPCACEGTPVTLYTSYGGGYEWSARACLEHRRITHQRSPYDEENVFLGRDNVGEIDP